MPTTTTPATAPAVATFAALEAAWNAADGAAFAEPFAADADFVDVRGDHHVGAAAIAAGHEAILHSIYAGSTVRYEVEQVRPLAEGVAVAVVGATLEAPTGPLQGTNRSRVTAILVERDGGHWEVAAFHNTLRMG